MIEIYLIAALSFGIMFSFRYIKEIVFMVKNVAKTHGIDQKDNTLYALSTMLGVLSVIGFPAYALLVIFSDRKKVIMDYARLILLKYYDLELKTSS